MNVNTLLHPEDVKALNALKSIPALPNLMEKVFQYGYDVIAWSENVTTNLRLSETQMPEVYNRLPPICERLGIPVPELYLQMTPIANSWTSGQTKPYIVVTHGLIKRLTLEELDAVLAHECGHIICEHVLYQTLANAIFSIGDTLADSLVGFIGAAAMKPIKQALVAWSRASELSADRFACIVSSSDTLARALARVDSIPRYIVKNMDVVAWAEQGKDYVSFKNSTAWNKVVYWLSVSGVDHPFSPVRVHEAMQWENTDTCKQLKSAPFLLEHIEIEPIKDIQSTNEIHISKGIVNKGKELADRGQELTDKGKELLKNMYSSAFLKK